MNDLSEFIKDSIVWTSDTVQFLVAVSLVVAVWRRAGRRLNYTADNCAKRAMSVRHICHGAINLSMGIKATALVYTGHPPEVRID